LSFLKKTSKLKHVNSMTISAKTKQNKIFLSREVKKGKEARKMRERGFTQFYQNPEQSSPPLPSPSPPLP
jgi:hypothetical protein